MGALFTTIKVVSGLNPFTQVNDSNKGYKNGYIKLGIYSLNPFTQVNDSN